MTVTPGAENAGVGRAAGLACQTGTLHPAACPPGYWGVNCAQPCQCHHGGTCHPQDGSCFCPPGWTGHLCLEGTNRRRAPCLCPQVSPCPRRRLQCPGNLSPLPVPAPPPPGCSPGMFGANCSQPCQCGFGKKCHPETGACVCPPGHSGAPCSIGEFSRPPWSLGNQDTTGTYLPWVSARIQAPILGLLHVHCPQRHQQSQDSVLSDRPTH